LKKYINNIEKTILTVLCLIGIIGFLFPAFNLNLEIFNNSTTISLSLGTLFENTESRFGGSDFLQADMFNFSGDNILSDVFANFGEKLIRSVGSYFVTLIILIITLIFAIINKFKKTSIVMLAISLIMFVYAGSTILSVVETLVVEIQSMLGFIAMLIDISEIITVTLGNGYWLTIATITSLLITQIIFYIIKWKRVKVEDELENIE
jgi:hypothetical protein